MASPLRSIADFMTQQSSYGNLDVLVDFKSRAGGTAGTVNSGYNTIQRCEESLIIPSMTSPVTGAYCTFASVISQGQELLRLGIETVLGTLTVSGNSYAAGSSMPTRKIAGGSSAATAAYDAYIYIDTAVTATAPVLTITYTNEAGTTNRTATLTLPNSPIKWSAFRLGPHLQSGDYGIKAVTNMSISTGSAGVIKIVGLLPITSQPLASTGLNNAAGSPISKGNEIYAVQGGDVVACYRYNNNAADRILAHLVFSPET